MKKVHLLTMIVSFCLIISLIAGSIDYSFLGATAETESVVPETQNETESIKETDSEGGGRRILMRVFLVMMCLI